MMMMIVCILMWRKQVAIKGLIAMNFVRKAVTSILGGRFCCRSCRGTNQNLNVFM